jgi:hypothetical protein
MNAMPQYLLSVIQPEGDPPPAAELDAIMREVRAVEAEMREAGVWVFAGALHPPSAATMVRPREGGVTITDGPYVEGKEHLGGFTIIRAADLDAALGWGEKCARAIGLPIEVRPFQA